MQTKLTKVNHRSINQPSDQTNRVRHNRQTEKIESKNNFHVIDYSFTSFPLQEGRIQPKLKINHPNDKYEQEADAIADRIMCRGKNKIQPQNVNMGGTSVIHRKCAECKKEEEELRRKPQSAVPDNFPGNEVSPVFHSRLNSFAGKGIPLPAATGQFMSQAFGADFSHVRLHTGSEAVRMNQDLNARAFTYGSDIYFNRGEYNPASLDGRHLLGHELTHVIQQGGIGSAIQMQRRSNDPNVFETEHNGDHYRVRRIRVPRRSRSSRAQPPHVGVDVDSEKVTVRISWCQGTRGEVRIGANLTGQALSLAKDIAGIIARGGSGDEVLQALQGTDVTPFVETVVAKSGQWRIFVRGDVTVGASGVTAGSGSIGIRRGPVDVEIAGEGSETGGNVSVRVRVTPGRTDERFTCPREVTVRQTYINRYICERLVPAHQEPRTRTRQRTDEQVRYIYFDFAKDIIDETRSSATLASLEDLLTNGYRVTRVEGFTSPEGPESRGRRFIGNTELAQKRADAALARLQAICNARNESLLATRHCAENAATNVTPAGQGELYGRITEPDGTTRELRGRELQEHTVEEFGSQQAESPHRDEAFMRSLQGLTPQQQADRIYPLLRRAAVVLAKEVTEQYQEQVDVPSGYREVACPREVITAARTQFNIQDAVRTR